LIYLTELDFRCKAALVAVLDAGPDERIVGVARYAVDPESPVRRAEFAITVEDAQQGRGIGRRLLDHLARVARQEGFEELEAFVLSDNMPMIRLLEGSGRVLSRAAEARVCHLILTTRAETCPARGTGGRRFDRS
jgi:acetyltransferase